MMKWMLAAGAAALAITAPVAAERGGKGGGGQHAQSQKGQRSGGDRQAHTQRSGSGGNRQAHMERSGGGTRQAHAGSRHNQQMAERGHGQTRSQARVESHQGNQNRRQAMLYDRHGNQGHNRANIDARGMDHAGVVNLANRDRGREHVRTVKLDRNAARGNGNARFAVVDGNDIVRVRDVNRGVVRVHDIDRDDLFVRSVGFGVGGCPPGLAKKAVACMPPGQAAKLVGQPLAVATRYGALSPLPLSMRSLYYDNDDYYYRWGGGYLYQVDRSDAIIASMIPLFGAALVGQPLAASYINPYYQPSYFNAFYPNSPYDCYRYGYGYVYETNCMSGMVENVIPTYDYGYGVGQIMPASYSYYNVPYAYRSYFADNNDYYYRYAPGAIYQVDRSTALISAVAALLTGGLTVGQPLPIGYSAYNVPLAYRASYYDTPDIWYRYDNGYIYAVDPGSRMVRNVVYVV